MSDESSTVPGPIRMRRGVLWLLGGSALLIGTYTLSGNDVNRLAAYGLLVLGLYLVVLAVEKMIGGYRAGMSSGDPQTVRSVRRAGIVCLLVAAAVVSSGYAAYVYKRPYWSSIRSLTAGIEITPRFLDIMEKHAESLESGVTGEDALELWKETAEEGLAMRQTIVEAHEGARYLARHADGDLRSQAEALEPFYSACLEWIAFYEQIDHAFQEESMAEPQDDWAEEHDRLHQKLHDVQPNAIEGS